MVWMNSWWWALSNCSELPSSPVIDFEPRATVVDSPASLRQTLRTGRPLVGGLSFPDVSGLCMNLLAHGLPRGIQAQGMRRRPMQALVSCSGCRTTACDPHALGGDQCGQHHGPTSSTAQQFVKYGGLSQEQVLDWSGQDCNMSGTSKTLEGRSATFGVQGLVFFLLTTIRECVCGRSSDAFCTPGNLEPKSVHHE